MNAIKRLLLKSSFFRKTIHRSGEEIHKQKLNDISKHLREAKNDLIKLLPTQMWQRFESEAYVSGGCIYSLYHDKQPKDYDFFLVNQSLVDELRKYFIDHAGYHGSDMSSGVHNDLPLIITNNAISIGKYQIITQWVGEPQEVTGQFDFGHNMFYWRNEKIYTLSDWSYLKGNALVYNEQRARDIVGTIVRVPRFVQRGMTITQKEMSKVLLKLNSVGFTDKEIEILENNKLDRFGS
ncbi:hypothetical protein [Paenibacillus sp. 1781tsa1]|uniref:hypothetical protein n=1 Tax=Paenibacillus sp. 1781tsa1 TaxID=2953810 RepID=UPI0020A09FE7|nr:hypothetical protein [Paenibacillus sp. 1781tsa1]MCP1185005.1 hypothetical protein [Paenibacillus sp. 1781tsa1]